MIRPHPAIVDVNPLHAHVLALDRLEDARCARVAQIADIHVAVDRPFANDGDVLCILGMDQGAMPFTPSAFPAHIHDRVIIRIRAADERCA